MVEEITYWGMLESYLTDDDPAIRNTWRIMIHFAVELNYERTLWSKEVMDLATMLAKPEKEFQRLQAELFIRIQKRFNHHRSFLMAQSPKWYWNLEYLSIVLQSRSPA